MNSTDRANPQKQHYEKIHDAYEAHYYDATCMAYRHRYIYAPLFERLALNGKSVADLACGSGHNSLALRTYFPSVRTVGYDISEAACRDYELRTGSPARQLDLTRRVESVEIHDAAMVIGGLHHCISDLETTFANIAQIIRPGGHLLMMEPSDDFCLSGLRRLWYKKDRWFEASSEAALKHDDIAHQASPLFTPERVQYFGGPAFYIILNSLILRVPLCAKPVLAPVLDPLERIYNKLPLRSAFAAFLAIWRRSGAMV